MPQLVPMEKECIMPVLIVLLVLALILGGVGLAVKGLIWLVIIGALLLLAAIVWGVVKRAALFASRK
jgi:uncharacterized membrane protein